LWCLLLFPRRFKFERKADAVLDAVSKLLIEWESGIEETDGKAGGGDDVGGNCGGSTFVGMGGGATASAKAGTVLVECVARQERYPRPHASGEANLTTADEIGIGFRTELEEDED